MKKLFKNMKENEKGFTLIELIVVIAIIGILAAVLLPKFSGFTDKARTKAVLSEAKSMYTVYAAVQAEKGIVTDDDIKSNLGKLPKGDSAGAVIVAGFVKPATTATAAGTDPVIGYTTVVSGKPYIIEIIDGGAIDITGPELPALKVRY